MSIMATYTTIDAYLKTLPQEQRIVLERLRRSIKAVVPKAEEVISYGIPAFRYNGRMLVGFNASRTHCTLQLMSTSLLERVADDLTGYKLGRGSVQFTTEGPLPATLVAKLVRARIAENQLLDAARSAERKKPSTPRTTRGTTKRT